MANSVRILRLTARCPKCHAPVRLRNTTTAMQLLDLARSHPQIGPDDVLQTYQCARVLPNGSLCNALVEIRVRHWREDT